MARFRANQAGDITQFLATYAQEKQFPTPPVGTAYELAFDETTNAGLVSAYQANGNQFRMDGGTLTQNDVEVTINPPDLFYRAFTNRVSLLSKLRSTSDPLTREEQAQLGELAFRGSGLA